MSSVYHEVQRSCFLTIDVQLPSQRIGAQGKTYRGLGPSLNLKNLLRNSPTLPFSNFFTKVQNLASISERSRFDTFWYRNEAT